MKYQVAIRVIATIADTKDVMQIVHQGEATDELQAKGIASSISGCDFLAAKDLSPYGSPGWAHTYVVRLTNTTGWILNVL